MSTPIVTQHNDNVKSDDSAAGGSPPAHQAPSNDPALLKHAGHLPASTQIPQLPSEPPAASFFLKVGR